MHKPLTTLLVAILISFAVNLHAAGDGEATPEYLPGTHYQVLDKPVRTSDPKRVEATEVFWYGCSHCYDFEPTITAWQKALPEDVAFVSSPAIWHPTMELHARAYYTAKVLNVLDKMHPVIFEAMNIRKNKLADDDAIADLFVAHGVDREKFTKAFNSFGVNSAVKQAEARQRGYQIQGTPELIVNGKYRVTAAMGGGHEGMMKIVDYLIGVERASLQAGTNSQRP